MRISERHSALKAEHRLCTGGQSDRAGSRCIWCGEHVGSSVCRCRSICHCDLKFHACIKDGINIIEPMNEKEGLSLEAGSPPCREVIYQKDHAFRFLMEMQMEYSFEKNVSISSG